MSDTALGAGWWRAGDGRWYPPELRRPGHDGPGDAPAGPEAGSTDEGTDPEASAADDPAATPPLPAVEEAPPPPAPRWADTPIGAPADPAVAEALPVPVVDTPTIAAPAFDLDDFWTAEPGPTTGTGGDPTDPEADPGAERGAAAATDPEPADAGDPDVPVDELVDLDAFDGHDDWVSVHSLVYRPDTADGPVVEPAVVTNGTGPVPTRAGDTPVAPAHVGIDAAPEAVVEPEAVADPGPSEPVGEVVAVDEPEVEPEPEAESAPDPHRRRRRRRGRHLRTVGSDDGTDDGPTDTVTETAGGGTEPPPDDADPSTPGAG